MIPEGLPGAGDILLCDARANYWAGQPPMRRVAMRHIPESGNLRLQLEGGEVTPTASVGACVFPDDAHTMSELLSNADAALYRAKNRGRNRVALEIEADGMAPA